jgi:thiol:disulfide interchange protein DsbC
MKRTVILMFFLLLILPACGAANNSSTEEMFKKTFPNKHFESISPTPVKGVYEVYTGNELFYYAPEAEVLIYGNIVTKEGTSFTRDSYLKKMAAKMSQLPLDKALKVGTGKTVIVEFMDPNCHYCKLSYNYLSQRKDITVYVFFYPLSPASEKKIKHIFCAADPARMYEEVMQGKFDEENKLNICNDKKAEETLKTHRMIAAQIGVRSTPFFYIKGQVVDGFEPKVFEKLFKD